MMVRTVADLLEAMRSKELEILDRQKIKHGPTIGGMYEGLTRAMLDRAVFEGLNLRVVQGVIEGVDGRQSKQIDCMLVTGDGQQLPYSENFIYPTSQVIAVVEVKKNFYSADLASAYGNLLSLVDVLDPSVAGGAAFRDAWRGIMGSELPNETLELSLQDRFMYNTLLVESVLPVRIALGYHGFASEFSLRKAFLKHIETNALNAPEPTLGFEPHSFPNLIMSGPHALVKLNGLPFFDRMSNDGLWRIYGSASGISMRLMLEVIWTKLAYRFELGAGIFGDDLTMERLATLLSGRPYEAEDGIPGWEYDFHEFTVEELEAEPNEGSWEPVTLTFEQYSVISTLCLGKTVHFDAEFRTFLQRMNINPDAFLYDLLKTRLVYVDGAGKLNLLTDACTTATLPDGRYIAGENKTGRLTRWIEAYVRDTGEALHTDAGPDSVDKLLGDDEV